MHKRSWHPIYTSEGSYYLILYTRSSVHLFAISCDAQLLLQFPSELDLFEICHYGIQSFRHPVISTPSQFDTFWSFRPIFWSIRPTIFFVQQMVVSIPFISSSLILSKTIKYVFLFAQYVVNISILLFFLQYIVKNTSSPMFMFTFFVLLLQIHYHLDTYSGGIVFADIGN